MQVGWERTPTLDKRSSLLLLLMFLLMLLLILMLLLLMFLLMLLMLMLTMSMLMSFFVDAHYVCSSVAGSLCSTHTAYYPQNCGVTAPL